MVECFICGVSSERERLFDAIVDEGVVKVCEQCARDESIPIVKKPTTFQLKKSEEKKTFREEAEDYYARKREIEVKMADLKKQETSLREIVDKNYELKISKEEKGPRPDLVENFHWIVMRARRKKHLSHKQLAEGISESEVAIKMAEKGILPEDENRLVKKLENYLGIRIRKSDYKQDERKQPARILNFKPETMENLTISDLQEMKKAKEK